MSNTNDVGRAFLHWLAEHPYQPNPSDFLRDTPSIDGVPITDEELTKAVVRAESYGLLTGVKVNGLEAPLRVPPARRRTGVRRGLQR